MWRQLRSWLAPIVYLSSNWISLTGVVLVTTAGMLWLFLLPSMLRGNARDAYLGILQFLVLPGAFFAGLGLIPVGEWWYRRRNRGRLPEHYPPVDLANPRFRRLLAFIGATTVANLVIGSQFTYRAIHYMDTAMFCGQTCHTVMKPEFTAYQNSPHSRVPCVDCHIGPGADWFVQSKLSGAWQVVSVAFDLYPRPIPTPVHNLRPARETCEVCHWPQKFGGNRIRVIETFSEDERAKALKTVLMMKIGGGGGYEGIHGAHMGPGVVMRYAHADGKRFKIPWVEYSRNGRTSIFKAEDYKGDGPGQLPVRVMDCMDCHTRPSHAFELPGRSVDHALSEGRLDRSLPFIKKVAVEILTGKYDTTAQAEREIPRKFTGYYRDRYPQLWESRRAAVENNARSVLDIFSRNVFPEMRVTWGIYPNHIGHTDYDGCFRCHDGRASTTGGRSVTQDCDACHQTLAADEENPKILTDLGLAPAAHPRGSE
jgi:hypothetical protein